MATDTITISEAEYLELTKAYEGFIVNPIKLLSTSIDKDYDSMIFTKNTEIALLVEKLNKLLKIHNMFTARFVFASSHYHAERFMEEYTPEIQQLLNEN